MFLSSENGGEKTLTIQGPGSLLGEAAFFDGLPRVSSARALVRSEILPVRREQLTSYFREDPNLAMEMLRYLARTVRMLSDQVDNITFLQADRRIAVFSRPWRRNREALSPVLMRRLGTGSVSPGLPSAKYCPSSPGGDGSGRPMPPSLSSISLP